MRHLCCYVDSSVFGGMETSLGTLLRYLDPSYRVSLLGTDQKILETLAAARPGATVHVVPVVRGKFDLGAISSHIRALRRLRADLLLVSVPLLYRGQYALIAGFLTRTPNLFVVHSVGPSSSRIQAFLYRRLLRRVAAIGGVSRWICSNIETELGIPLGTVRLLYNGVPEASLPRREARNGWDAGDPPTIGAVGRLSPEKGFDLLIQAMEYLPGYRLLILGDGPEGRALKALAEKLGVADQVAFTGWVDPPWTDSYEFDVVAIPSEVEAFGLVAVEAMRVGIPVVATRVGGLPEVIEDGITGLLVPPADAEALADAIRRLIENRPFREGIGSSASTRMAQRFTPEEMAGAYEGFFQVVR